MENILKVLFGSIDKPIVPIWIFFLSFALSIIMTVVSSEAGMITSIVGIALFISVTIYNAILLLIGNKRRKMK